MSPAESRASTVFTRTRRIPGGTGGRSQRGGFRRPSGLGRLVGAVLELREGPDRLRILRARLGVSDSRLSLGHRGGLDRDGLDLGDVTIGRGLGLDEAQDSPLPGLARHGALQVVGESVGRGHGWLLRVKRSG
jgi:hypothetical protein